MNTRRIRGWIQVIFDDLLMILMVAVVFLIIRWLQH